MNTRSVHKEVISGNEATSGYATCGAGFAMIMSMTDALSVGYADCVERGAHGQPRIKPSAPEGTLLRGDDGRFLRRAWVWFPDNVNHYIGIDRYGGDFYRVHMGCHHRWLPRIDEIWYPAEPTDDQMRELLKLTRFLEPHHSSDPNGSYLSLTLVIKGRLNNGAATT